MDGLQQRVEQVIAGRRLIPDGARALVAVSGGVDSMVLLHVLAQLAPKHRWKLTIAHFNHQLRGRAADADESFVAHAAKKLGLTCECARHPVAVFARENKLSLEMAARKLRHQFLADTARRLKLRHIFLAHHAGDQAELFFLRLLRGAGSLGLGGMDWSAPSPVAKELGLLRPLLKETKAQLSDYARAHGVTFREDATNRSVDILRNRIRNELLPLLREYQPALDRAVGRSMELIHDDGEFVTCEALAWLGRKRCPAFAVLHVSVQRRVVQIGLLKQRIVPQFEHVEALRARANQWITLERGVECRRTSSGKVEKRVTPTAQFRADEQVIELGRGSGRASFGSLKVQWRQVRGSARPRPVANMESFDADAVRSRISLRHWRAGDRFQPIGMARAVKLQDFFVNQKVPRELRHELVVATTSAGDIFWIEGARIGERFKVTSGTKRILRWNWERNR